MSRPDSQRGFTIIEFMIATMVFSVILLVVTAAILYMSRAYQRSLYASSTQAATSNLVDTVAQSVKFSTAPVVNGGVPSNGSTATYCIGNRQFLYVIGRQLGGSNANTTTRNVIVTRQNNNCPLNDIITTTPTGSPKELLGRGMRLAKFDVVQSGPLYTITARVVYGDDEVLCSDMVSGSCDSPATMTAGQLRNADLKCRPGIGSEFCAVSELSTTVYRRL